MKEHYNIENGLLLSNEEGARQLAHHLISCSIPKDDDFMKEIVTNVQTHKHTESCRKYDGNCRFHFPRFPNYEPLPILAGPPNDMEEGKLETIKQRLKKIKQLLETPNKMFVLEYLETIESILSMMAQ